MLMDAESLKAYQYIVESKYFHSRELSPTLSRMLQFENSAVPLQIRQVYHLSACIPVSSSHLVSAVTKNQFGKRFSQSNLRHENLLRVSRWSKSLRGTSQLLESKYSCTQSVPYLTNRSETKQKKFYEQRRPTKIDLD